jgi:hypothetical protein
LKRHPFIFCFLFLIACGSPSDPATIWFERGVAKGTNDNEALEEASGLVASRRYPGMLWTHNDSGHPPELFLLDTLGATRRTFRIIGAANRDWEDITLGPGRDSIDYIYIADIGDNGANHKIKFIYCVEEPSADQEGELTVVDTLLIRLADKKRDTETLMVDPVSHNLYLVSKREDNVSLYEVKFPFAADTLTAEPVLSLPIRGVVAGDISPDGREILLKTYDNIYYWRRLARQSVADALQAPAIELAYLPEPQGESIAWAVDGSGFYTLGENAKGERSKLFFYARKLEADSSAAPKSKN